MKLIKSKLYVGLVVALSVLVCFVAGIMLMSAPKTAFAVEVEYGSGAEGDIYLISSANELYALSQTNSDWGKNFKLTQDINLSTVCYEGKSWMPIGSNTNKFKGTFDGDNHTISGLYIDSTAGCQGLFGYVENGTIKNLKVKGTVSGNGYVGGIDVYVGGIVGYFNIGTVEKCSFEGTVKGGSLSQAVGGIAGYNHGGTIKECSNRGEVSCSNKYAGGIVGQNYGQNTIVSDCENTGTVSLVDSTGSSSTAGGIAGINVGGSKILNCSNTGKIGESNNLIVGGIVGTNNTSSVTQCYNTGIVTGSKYIGGVAGQNTGKITITQCYNTGAVSGSQYIGGVTGQNEDSATIMSCYNTATVTGSSIVGGLVGQNYGGTSRNPTLGTVKNCYNRGTVTGNNSGGVVGLNKGNNIEGTVENCYYLTDTASGGGAAGALVKTQNEFASGEVTWLLQKWQPDYGTQVWGQWLKGTEHEIEKYPVLTDQLPKRVWKASFIKNGETIYVTYVNNGGTITPPTDDVWCEPSGARFTSTVQITEDKVLGLRVCFGSMTNNLITLDYGQSAERNLDEWLEYEDGSSTEDKFSYTITDYDGLTGAYLEGNTLKIPSGTNVKEGGYVLQIKAHENNPRVDTTVNTAAFAVSDFGVEDVILTVTVVVNKINQDPFTIDEIPLGVTYGDQNVKLGTTGGSGDGNIVWNVESGKQYVEVGDSGELTILGAGEVVISATKSGGGNYYDAYDTINLVIHKAHQTDFTIDEIPLGVTYGDIGKTLGTTGGSGDGKITWNVENGKEFVDVGIDGELNIKGAGNVTISATKSGGANYEDAYDTVSFTIHKAVQLDFTIIPPSVITFGDSGITLKTSGGRDGGTVTWTVSDGGIFADIDSESGEITIKGVGKVTFCATKSGGDNYEDATDSVIIQIQKAVQPYFSINTPDAITYSEGATLALSVSGGREGGPVTWSVVMGKARFDDPSNGEITVLGAGAVTVTAFMSGGANYEDTSDTITFTVKKANQPAISVSFKNGVSEITYGDENISLEVSGGRSGGRAEWTVPDGSCVEINSITGALTILRVGIVTVTVFMEGDDNYLDTSATFTFTVNKAHQAPFALSAPAVITYAENGTFTLTATGGTGSGSVTWKVIGGADFATHAGGGVFNILGAGTVTVTAIKDGGENYLDATDTITVTVNKASQPDFVIITPGTLTYSEGGTFTLTATGGTGNGSVTWKVIDGADFATHAGGGVFNILGAGTVTVTAVKDGGENYLDATDTVTFEIYRASQYNFTIIAPEGGITYAKDGTFILTVTGGSGGGAVTWSIVSGIENAELNLDAYGTFNIKHAGSVTITATKSGGDNYLDATDTIVLEINKAVQSPLQIFGVPDETITKESNFDLSVSGGSSKEKVEWSIDGNATISDSGHVTILGVGETETVVITAKMPGGGNYYDVSTTITLHINQTNQAALYIKGPGSITFNDNNNVVVLECGGGSGTGTLLTWSVVSGNAEFADSSIGVLTILGAGEIVVSVTKAGDRDYYKATASTSVTVNKAYQRVLNIFVPDSITYSENGTFTLTTDGGEGGTVTWRVISGESYAEHKSGGEFNILGAGTVTVTAVMDGGNNYYDTSATVTFTVAKANQEALSIDAPDVITYAENGTFTLNATGGSYAVGTITWLVVSGENYAEYKNGNEFTILGAGTVTVTAIKSGGDNYNDVSVSITFNINKADQDTFTIDAPGAITYLKNGTFTLNATGGSYAVGTVSWLVVSGESYAEYKSGNVFNILGAGTVIVTATKAGGDNYNDISTSITFTINKANQDELSVYFKGDVTDVTYGDKNVALAVSGGREGGIAEWTVPEDSCVEINGATGALTILRVGTVTVTVFMEGDDNYLDASATFTFTVNKAYQPQFSVHLPDDRTGVAYGDNITLVTIGGLQGGTVIWSVPDDACLSVSSNGDLVISGIGTVTVTATILGGENYHDATASITFTVNKANQTPLIIDAPNGIVYGEKDIVLKVSGGRDGGTVEWSVPDDSCIKIDRLSGAVTVEKTGIVTITAFMSGGDYYFDTFATVTFAVNKANQNALVIKDVPSGITYEKDGTFTLTAEGGRTDGIITWSVDNESVITHLDGGVFKIIGVGNVTVTAGIDGGTNYYDISTSIQLTVNKANQEAFKIVDLPNAVVYSDGTFTLSTEGGNAGGIVSWNVESGDNFVSHLGNGVFKIIGVGEVVISATNSCGDNYYDITTSIRLLIEKATPNVTLPDALTAHYGDTLAEVALPQGWAWMDSTLSVGGIGVRGFSAIYTPSDTANYNTVTAVLTITVVKATPAYTLPTALTATYGDTLASVLLPAGWTWNDALTTKVGKAGQRTFTATFTPSDTENYETVTVALTITVQKAIPQFTLPDGLKATVGDTLADVALPAGWAWNDALTTKVGKAGQRTFTATFTPSDTENYETVTVTLTITVEEKAHSGFWWWWILLIIVILLLLLLVLLLIFKKRKKENKEEAVKENTTSQPQAVLQTAGKQQAPAENESPTIAQAPQTPLPPIVPFFMGGATNAPHYKKSFTAHMIQSSDKTKLWYSDIKNELMSYKRIHNRTSWKHETFRCGRKTVAKLKFRGKTLYLYLALNAADYTDRYPIEDAAQNSAKYSATPLLIRLKNDKHCKIAKQLIGEAMKQSGVEPLPECASVDYRVPYESTEELVEKGFVKRIDKNQ